MQKQIRNVAKRIPGARGFYRGLRRLCFYVQGGTRYRCKYYNTFLFNAIGGQSHQSDISDHYGTIFFFATDANSKLMVELGTRDGESTRVLLAAASITNSVLLSIDIEDCEQISIPFRERWHFVKADDIEFGKTEFNNWCLGRSIEPVIDVLFIDTSHEYIHTKQEIEIWSKYLSDNGITIFHDTNMGKGMYGRYDGSIDFGGANKRGVVRAIEEFVGRQYDENSFFCDVTDKYSLIHFPNSNGLTIIKKRNEDA